MRRRRRYVYCWHSRNSGHDTDTLQLIEKWETFLMQLDAEDDEAVFYRPPVVQSNKPAGNTAVDRARARIDEDSD